MSFWNSRKLKARKEHKCLYCGKGIAIGETYWRETGIFEGDFNDYCLDELCNTAVNKFYQSGDELGELFENLTAEGIIECPKCKSDHLDWHRTEHFAHKYNCKCDKCGTEWDIELTEELIKGGQQ